MPANCIAMARRRSCSASSFPAAAARALNHSRDPLEEPGDAHAFPARRLLEIVLEIGDSRQL